MSLRKTVQDVQQAQDSHLKCEKEVATITQRFITEMQRGIKEQLRTWRMNLKEGEK